MNKIDIPTASSGSEGTAFADQNQNAPRADTSQNSAAINLPKGGGAIRGITEKFSANAVTGTSSLSIPLPVGLARGFQPEASLSYDSGSGNSEFGLGWNISLPSISRRTDKQLPTYNDELDSDTYSGAGLDDLVPVLGAVNQQPQTRVAELSGVSWEVKLYRSRVESGHQKIERWRDPLSNRIWWRTISAENVTTVFGFSDEACIFKPGNRSKTFKWFAELSYDDKGHVTKYQYRKEDSTNVDVVASHEHHRELVSYSKVYLKKILHGIKQSRLKSGLDAMQLIQYSFNDLDFHFQTIFDYGDHSDENPSTNIDQPWPVRSDAFSSYRAGFEVRTYRCCQRVLLFHDFAELGLQPTLVSSIKLAFEESDGSFSFLTSIEKSGYIKTTNGYTSKSLPSMEFEYQAHAWNNDVKRVDKNSLRDIPAGIEGSGYQWLDLHNEGLSGLLSESPGGLYYKQNQGHAKLAQAQILVDSPTLRGLGSAWNFQDLEANGSKCLVSTNGVAKGYYQFDTDQSWQQFIAFAEIPNISFDDPNLRIIDLNGDGKPDLLVSEDQAFHWYPSKGKQGYAESLRCNSPTDEGESEIVFANQSESIFLTDMSGDGLSDIVRLRNGSVVYWPNLGYGQFGSKVTMTSAPRFDFSDQFNPANIRLADIDGSGLSDLIYLGKNEVQYWLNQSGNSWSKGLSVVNPFPDIDTLSSVSVIDFLGSGTACLVHSSSAPANSELSIHYVDLMQGKKPHLLKNYRNGFGKTVNFEYTPSTTFYLEDKKKGEPWITKLQFPVQCLSKCETIDEVSGTRFTSSYSYHHGYYDKAEREFRGFGRVEQLDSEAYDHFIKSESSNVVENILHQTPVLTKTWFHLGVYLDEHRVLSHYQSEYFQHSVLQNFELSEPELSQDLSAAERRQAFRACKGMALRSEIYGLDGTDLQDIPFTLSTSTCLIQRVQPTANNQYAVFQVFNTESVSFTLDRNPDDPRISHNLLLATDVYGRPVQSAVISYGRNPAAILNSNLPEAVSSKQRSSHCVISEVEYADDEYGPLGQHEISRFEAPYRLPPAWRNQSYEYGLESEQWSRGKIRLTELAASFNQGKQQNLVPYLRANSELDVAHVMPSEVRLLSAQQTRFANDQLDGELPAGQPNPLGISWQSYQLAFTPDLIRAIYGEKIAPDSLSGGFVDLDQDGNWWMPSGHSVYSIGASPQASDRFYLPYGLRDSMGAASWTELDDYLMLPVASSVSRVSETAQPATLARINESIAVNDYRTLSGKYMRDANQNWAAVETDALGVVIKSAVMGKVDGADRHTPPSDDALSEGDNLNNPSSLMDYRFYQAPTETQPVSPARVSTRTFTQHFSQSLTPRENLNSYLDFIDQYEYTDGSGEVVMVKQQTTPGLAKIIGDNGIVVEVDTGDAVRWIGNGRTIINNKGNPVKQYEPYFSATPDYEDDPLLVEIGITPILFYDAAGRNICKLNPDKTYEKIVFDAWQQASWDVNDTLFLSNETDEKITDIRQDPDAGHFFTALDESLVSPSWYAERISGNKGTTPTEKQRNQRAALISESHAQTPSLAHTDSLGRTIYAVGHNRVRRDEKQFDDQYHTTQTHLDIEGNMLAVVDARANTVIRYRYNMLPAPDEDKPKAALYQNSMDAGEKWSSFDIQGKPIRSWDSRNHEFENQYDDLHRASTNLVKEAGFWKQVSLQNYLDSDSPDAQQGIENNLLASVIESFDQSGRVQAIKSDFKGNTLSSKRTLAADYQQTIDWSQPRETQLEPEDFFVSAEYDAMNRVTRSLSPHNDDRSASESNPEYNESGALGRVRASTPSSGEKNYVQKIEYNAKGQRQLIEYGNGLITSYVYEPDTYRLKQLRSESGNAEQQNLSYTYDPAGNITEIHDAAQSTVYFDNVAVEPHSQYEYDALYRLISASGREHAVQATCPDPTQGFVALPAGNHNELQRYQQRYEYDVVGNFESMAHIRFGGNNRSNTGWTRSYENDAHNNRLLSTELSCASMPVEPYSYNEHGSITSMAHLPTMAWDYAEQLRHVDLQGGGHAYYVYDGSGERTRKVVETNGALLKERIYLGGWELYRERNANSLLLERETLHIMDDTRRIALVESKTKANNVNITEQSVIRYQLDNQLGSACWEIGENLELISYEEYHPYGTTAYHASNSYLEHSAKRYRYTGKERDEETGFSYHSARFLIVALGRWASSDPIGIDGGMNLYAYALENPVVLSDQSGTNPFSLDPLIDRYEKSVENEYQQLEARIENEAKASKAPIHLSHDDLRIISEAMYFKGATDYESGDSYVDAMGVADTFLYDASNVSRDFIVDGVSYKGGEINYIGVGAYNISYGVPVTLATSLIAVETVAWNLDQFLDDGNRGELPQTVFGNQWAQYGTLAAENIDAKIDIAHALEFNATDLIPLKKGFEVSWSLSMDVSSVVVTELGLDTLSDFQKWTTWIIRPPATFAGDMAAQAWKTPQGQNASKRAGKRLKSTKKTILNPMRR